MIIFKDTDNLEEFQSQMTCFKGCNLIQFCNAWMIKEGDGVPVLVELGVERRNAVHAESFLRPVHQTFIATIMGV